MNKKYPVSGMSRLGFLVNFRLQATCCMRLNLTLHTNDTSRACLPVNYQYPLAAAIYKILATADAAYASFLHNTGYSEVGSLKKFKLFTFSDITAPFNIQGDRMLLKGPEARVTVCFHIPGAAENFIKGLFINQHIEIADKKSKVVFTVQQVEAEAGWQEKIKIQDGLAEVIVQPISPIVSGLKNDKGNYTYLAPADEQFVPMLKYNLVEKYKAVYDGKTISPDDAANSLKMETIFYSNPPRSRLITIKADTEAETKVRGWDKFRIRLQAPADIIALALDAGIGLYNAMGMGCVEVVV